jgi:hypothetical protein
VAALIEKGAAAALEDLRAKRTTVESSAPAVSGFPTGVAAEPERPAHGRSGQRRGLAGAVASALRADSYAPWHLTASLPDAAGDLDLPGQTMTLHSQGMAGGDVGSAPDPDAAAARG